MIKHLDLPLAKIAERLRDGTTTAEELAALAVQRHERVGGKLHAYRSWDAEMILAQARDADAALQAGKPLGPLGGIPVSVKDLYGVTGYRTFAGTARQLPAEWETEGFLVKALKEQRAVLTGKTHTVELAFGGLGNNPHWGTPVNPWDDATDRVPGGSSCGAAVSLWEGSAALALGSDTAGSIRLPASMTGCVGHKTTYGRWPADGLVPLSHTLDSVGALCRSVEDAAFFFASVDAAHGDPEELLAMLDDQSLVRLRLGLIDARIWDESQDDIADCVHSALRELEAHGARLTDFAFPEFDAGYDLYAGGMIAAVECSRFVESHLPGWMDILHETVGRRLRDAKEVKTSDYEHALDRRQQLIAAAESRMEAVDVAVTPTVPFTPPPVSLIEDYDEYMKWNRRASLGTNPVNMLDLCAITLPCGLDSAGMPVGLQLVTRNAEDERLLAIALAAERVLGTATERLGTSPLGGVGS